MIKFTDYELNTIEKGFKYYNRNIKYDKSIIKNIRVCIYLRKSTEDIKDNSLKLQLNEINKFIHSINVLYTNEFNFYYDDNDIYSEDNVSGMKGRLRPEFDRMLSLIENCPGYYGVCLVYKLDRFSRKLEDTLKYITLLKSFKCVLKALDFEDNGDPTSDLLKNILGVVAQYHAQNSALTSIKGTMKKVEENKTVGLLPLGLISEKVKLGEFNTKGASKIVIDESKAFIIREIFEKYASGFSIKDIEKYLMDKGYVKNDGTYIKYQQIYYILRNKKYNGIYVYADPNKKRYYKYDNGVAKPEYYESKDAIPKIIEDELFEKVQLIIDSKKNSHQLSGGLTNYLLTGFMVCGDCGKLLHGWSRPKYKGKNYYDYVCTTHKKDKLLCSTKRINKLYVEKLIIDIIYKIASQILLLNKDKIGEVVNKKLIKLNSDIENIKKEINNRKLKINRLIDRMIEDEKRIDYYESKLSELESEVNVFTINLDNLTKKFIQTKSKMLMLINKVNMTKKLLEDNFNACKVLVNIIIKKIYLDNKMIKIEVN